MKTRHLFLTAILAFLALSAVQADTPELINYQGRLTNPDGSPQAGTKTFSLSIWDDATGGAALYSEDLGEILLDENGIYSFQFGADSAALAQALQAGGQHWIELTVDNAVLSPRQRILAVPFALKAAQADTATRAGSVGDDDGNVDITGNLDIAKNTTLQRDLNVEGDAIFRGIVDAERIFLQGGATRFDGGVNRISGLMTEIRSDLLVERNAIFESDAIFLGDVRFENPLIRFLGGDITFDNNRTTFNGEVRLNGPVTSDGEVNISGALNAGRLEVSGPGGITRIDGIANIINGFETRVEGGPLLVQGAVEALSFNNVSDRNLKENFEAVDGTEVLEKVTNLPVSTWNFIADEDSARHLGPTAQDFHAAFGLGEHETHISTVDASGVAIAAIQGLDSKVDATRAELLQSNAALLEMVQALQERLETLEANQ